MHKHNATKGLRGGTNGEKQLILTTDAKAITPQTATDAADSSFRAQLEVQKKQDAKQLEQLNEAEAMCEGCEASAALHSRASGVPSRAANRAWTFRSNVDEVSVLFVAADHGKPIRDLLQSEVTIRDAGKAPLSISAFRTESELPLRLGPLIDTSDSVASRFSFEQSVATDFTEKVLSNRATVRSWLRLPTLSCSRRTPHQTCKKSERV